jgi:hypothetical protein
MELIEMSGYVGEEKLAISKQYLVPQAMKDCGLTESHVRRFGFLIIAFSVFCRVPDFSTMIDCF